MRLPAETKHVEALPLAEARLVSLSAAVAAGDSPAVADAVESALKDGASPRAVYETIVQSYLFLGFPRTIEALFAAGPALRRRGGIPDQSAEVDVAAWRRDGETLCKKVYGRNFEKLLATMRGLSPDLASWMILEGYGKTLSRPDLSPAVREYCVVAILTITKMWRQLRSHAIGAVHVGGTRARVRESILLCKPLAGAATVEEALRVAGLDASDDR